MDIYETRKQNLRDLIATMFERNQTAFAKATKIKPPQVNRWISGKAKETRSITECSARRIEKILNLPKNFLDRPRHGAKALNGNGCAAEQTQASYGPPRRADWPFAPVDQARFEALAPKGQAWALAKFAAAIEEAEREFDGRGKTAA